MEFQLHPDLKRDGIPIADYDLSQVLMINDNRYPWFILVPKRPAIKDAYQLSLEDHLKLTQESRHFCAALMQAFNGEKMNVAALGNMTPQLHIHHIVRYSSDDAWPGPIWGKYPLTPLSDNEISTRLEALKPLIAPHVRFI